MKCQRSDDVLAHFLDGDPGSSANDALSISEHLADCGTCRSDLARARRLDALLARNSGSEVDDELASRLFSGIESHETTESAATGPSWTLRLVTAASLIAAGFIGAMFWIGKPAENIVDHDRPAEGVHVANERPAKIDEDSVLLRQMLASGAVLLPDPPLARPRKRKKPLPSLEELLLDKPVEQLYLLALDEELAQRMLAGVMARTSAFGWPTPRTSQVSELASTLRLSAGESLTKLPSRAATRALAHLLVANIDAELRTKLLTSTRENPNAIARFRGALSQASDDEFWQRVCAHIGDKRIDTQLRSVLATDTATADRIAAAANSPLIRPGRVPFLLDLWGDLDIRSRKTDAKGSDDPVGDRARLWFTDLPTTATLDLVFELKKSHNADRRRRCLLALAERHDGLAVEDLLAIVHGRRREESLLSAWAMSRSSAPDTVVTLTTALPRSRRPELLKAALASLHADVIRPWLTNMKLTTEEKRFLEAGSFSQQQFEIAAALFRDRGTKTMPL